MAETLTLAIDIGGSGLKAMLLNADGKSVSERERVPTPVVPAPAGLWSIGGAGSSGR